MLLVTRLNWRKVLAGMVLPLVVLGALAFPVPPLVSPFAFAHVDAVPTEPEVIPCVPINSAGLILVYRCVPDQGSPYIINSLGFLAFEP